MVFHQSVNFGHLRGDAMLFRKTKGETPRAEFSKGFLDPLAYNRCLIAGIETDLKFGDRGNIKISRFLLSNKIILKIFSVSKPNLSVV